MFFNLHKGHYTEFSGLCQAIRKSSDFVDTQILIIELFFHQVCFTLPGLIRIVRLRVVYAPPEAFAVLVLKIPHYVLINVIEFVKESLEIQIRVHLIMKFNFKLSGFPVAIRYRAPTIDTLSCKTTMIDCNFKFVAWKILFNKPFHSIGATTLAVRVSAGV